MDGWMYVRTKGKVGVRRFKEIEGDSKRFKELCQVLHDSCKYSSRTTTKNLSRRTAGHDQDPQNKDTRKLVSRYVGKQFRMQRRVGGKSKQDTAQKV